MFLTSYYFKKLLESTRPVKERYLHNIVQNKLKFPEAYYERYLLDFLVSGFHKYGCLPCYASYVYFATIFLLILLYIHY